MSLRLDPPSRDLLFRHSNGIFLGVLVRRRTIRLFCAGRDVDRSGQTFPGHQALVGAGVVKTDGAHGFSFQLRDGKVFRFYRNSILNTDLVFMCLPRRQMNKILEACGLDVAEEFECYP